MSKDSSLSSFWDLWFELKKEAIDTKDYFLYKWFLIETKKTLSKLYAESKWEPMQKFLEEVLKFDSCELKGIVIKSKESEVPF